MILCYSLYQMQAFSRILRVDQGGKITQIHKIDHSKMRLSPMLAPRDLLGKLIEPADAMVDG